MNFGFHISISGGLENVISTAVKMGCSTFQIFSRSPRGGRAKPFDLKEVTRYRIKIEEHKIEPVVVHMPYVLNLASPDEEMFKYAISLVKEDLERSNILGAQYLVLHVGSHKEKSLEEGLERMVRGVKAALQGYEGKTKLLLENTSGSGTEMGSKFEEMAKILNEVDSNMVAMCFDTCHAFGAGYDLRDEEKVEETLQELDKIIGIDMVKVIHCNDSKYPLGSLKDRHEHIGQGHIGLEGFEAIIHHPWLKKLPFILETPVDEKGDYGINLETLRKLAKY